MACVIHLIGDEADVDELLRLCPIEPATSFRRGEPRSTRPGARPAATSGIALVISEADFDSFDQQQADAMEFLRSHATAMSALRKVHGVTGAFIDFGISMRNVVAQSDTFSAELLKVLAPLALDLTLSQYPVAKKMSRIRQYRRALRNAA